MKFRYRSATIYVDLEGNMLFVPEGYSKKMGVAFIDNIIELKSPYTDDDIEMTLIKACDLCFTKEPVEGKGSPIERYLNIKGGEKATKDRKVVCFLSNKKDGCIIIPTKKIPKKGYDHMMDKELRLGRRPAKGEIAAAIRECIQLSTLESENTKA